jgi:hypothetical protein
MQPSTQPIGSRLYHAAVIVPSTQSIVLAEIDGKCRLPLISVECGTRAVREIRRELESRWGLTVAVLDFVIGLNYAPVAISELIGPPPGTRCCAIPISEAPSSELDCAQKKVVAQIASGDVDDDNPLRRVGWLAEAAAWVEESTHCSVLLPHAIEQYTAGGGFALLRLESADNRVYWLKAVGPPNFHEFRITTALAAAGAQHLPTLVASRENWRAWLMEDAGTPVQGSWDEAALCSAASALAQLQKKALPYADALIEAGARDHRSTSLKRQMRGWLPLLSKAMRLQTSTSVPKIDDKRLDELMQIGDEACEALLQVKMPDTILHGDLNQGNILFQGEACRFIDWAEARVGCPFLDLFLLPRLAAKRPGSNDATIEATRNAYLRCWRDVLTEEQLEVGLALAPLLAIASHLAGLLDPLRLRLKMDSEQIGYIRSLTRQLDREARNLEMRKPLLGWRR